MIIDLMKPLKCANNILTSHFECYKRDVNFELTKR